MLHSVLGHDLPDLHRAAPDSRTAFAHLRKRIEDARVFVLLMGDLGSCHTSLDVEFFRGFAIADDIAPFVVINDKDAPAAWSFTLLHEMVHLLLGQTGISGGHWDNAIESFCNDVAAEWLLPMPLIDGIDIDRKFDLSEQQRRIEAFAKKHNLSRTMVAYRLLRTDHIDADLFGRLQSAFRKQRQSMRDRQRAKASEANSGPNYYVVRRHRLGPALLRFTNRMLAADALSMTRAARILDAAPAQVDTLLDSAAAR